MTPSPAGARSKIRVLIADDHPIVLRGFAALLESTNRFDIVASCSNGNDALRGIIRHRPDVAILDINMPGMRGIDVARLMRCEGTRAVLLGAKLTSRDLLEAVRLKVAGIMAKGDRLEQIVKCIDVVASGGSYLPNTDPYAGFEEPPLLPGVDLTARELQVVELAAAGLSNKHIARQLSVSEGTVKIHMHHIFRKAGLSNRTELANLANPYIRRELPRPRDFT